MSNPGSPSVSIAARDLFLALPTYDGKRDNCSAIVNAVGNPGPFRTVRIYDRESSVLTDNFNYMWAKALNARNGGVTHFLMLHSDVCPRGQTWVDNFYGVMKREAAQVLSAVIPIKTARGLTSTAMEGPDVWHPRRLTLKELAKQPATFTAPGLLINTGMMLVDMRDPWVENVYFSINDSILKDASGSFYSVFEPEDWYFSRRAREQGARMFATREIEVTHLGRAEFPNWGAWGDESDWRAGASVSKTGPASRYDGNGVLDPVAQQVQ